MKNETAPTKQSLHSELYSFQIVLHSSSVKELFWGQLMRISTALVFGAIALMCKPVSAQDQPQAETRSADDVVAGCVRDSALCATDWYSVKAKLSEEGSVIQISYDPRGAELDEAVSWSVSCESDPITDEKQCELSPSSEVYIAIINSSISLQRLVVFGRSYPGTRDYIRIDSNPPISTPEDEYFSQSTTALALSQMRAGKGVVARYINWPYKNPVDGRINLTGFSRAHDLYQSLSRAYFRGEVLMSPPKELPPPADIFQINYPSRALREELEGTVTFSIVWGADGRPTSCTVIRSSGHLVLDDAACKGSMMWGRKPKGAPDIQEFDHQFKLR